MKATALFRWRGFSLVRLDLFVYQSGYITTNFRQRNSVISDPGLVKGAGSFFCYDIINHMAIAKLQSRVCKLAGVFLLTHTHSHAMMHH
jgi:hypothetical protein